jgi:hypothetical protein
MMAVLSAAHPTIEQSTLSARRRRKGEEDDCMAREFTVSMAFANFSLLTYNTFSPYRQTLKLVWGT